MKKPYRPPYPFVEIVWDDASSNSESWTSINDISAPEQVITRGWLVKETDTYVSVAASVANEELHEEVVGNTMTIPVGMVRSRRELNLSTKKVKQPVPEGTPA